jgi:hypothetical protein
MKIINNTHWNTSDLRKIFSACTREVIRREGRRPVLLDQYVRVKKTKKWVTGRAWYHTGSIHMLIPSVEKVGDGMWYATIDQMIRSIARIFIHEIGHNLGVRHTKARGTYRLTIEQHFSEWIAEEFADGRYPLGWSPPVKKVQTAPLQEQRYAKAVVNLKRAETRLKRAQTIAKKWRTKVRYYERALAAKKDDQ